MQWTYHITAVGTYVPAAMPERTMEGVLIIDRRSPHPHRSRALFQGKAPGVPDLHFTETAMASWEYEEVLAKYKSIAHNMAVSISRTHRQGSMSRLIYAEFTVNSGDPRTWIPELDMTLGQCMRRLDFPSNVLDLLF